MRFIMKIRVLLISFFFLNACSSNEKTQEASSVRSSNSSIRSISSSKTQVNLVVGPLRPNQNNQMGQLIISVCNNKACYKSDGEDPNFYMHHLDPEFPHKIELSQGQEYVTQSLFLDEGEYSIFIHHDRNHDDEVKSDTCGMWGKPTDGIGFSNNLDPRDEWGRPSWKQVKINIPQISLRDIEIHPIYMCDDN